MLVPMNTRADSQNSNKLTNHCLQRQPGWLGLHIIAERTEIRQECIPLSILETLHSCALQKVTESQKCPLYLSTSVKRGRMKSNSWHEGKDPQWDPKNSLDSDQSE